MSEQRHPVDGPIDGAARVLAELLKTPRFKQTVRILLNELDPESAARLVRVLIWTDPEFSLGLMAASPEIANVVIVALDETVRQLENLPPVLLSRFAAQVLERLDARRLGSFAGGAAALAAKTAAAGGTTVTEAASSFAAGFAGGLADGGIDGPGIARSVADGIASFARSNPEFMRNVVGPIAAAGAEAMEIARGGGDTGEVS